jgi:hypothetical protein
MRFAYPPYKIPPHCFLEYLPSLWSFVTRVTPGFRPFRADMYLGDWTQGVALGYRILPPLGQRTGIP